MGSRLQSVIVMALIGAAIGGVLFVATRGVRGISKAVATGAVDVVGSVLAGAAEGVAEGLGLPTTDMDKCASAKAEGSTLGVIAHCPGDGSANVWEWWWNK